MIGLSLHSNRTGEPLFLEPEEREVFFAATKSQEAQAKYFCQMLYYTGARLNEVLGITYESFDFERKGVMVRTLKQREREVTRFIHLPEAFLEVMNDVFQIKRNQAVEKKKEERVWGFTGRTGENYIKKVMTLAGISGKKANARGLRHAFGFAAAKNNVPTHQLQEWLGHHYPNSTVVYGMLDKEEPRNLAQKLWKKA
ncbi:MAG: tyrosine-type recombinase/integrase [Saprospiraceae bacterium]